MNDLILKIKDRHTHQGVLDEEQFSTITSNSSQLIVEAPAGYGKTTTMVSKIAYLIASGQVPYPKKLLTLTFSINAAFKIRKDLSQQLPELLSATPNLSNTAVQSVYATNYHGFCRRILGKYGHVINPQLRNIDSLRGVGIDFDEDNNKMQQRLINDLGSWGLTLTNGEIELLIQYTSDINQAENSDTRPQKIKELQKNFRKYLEIVEKHFLPNSYIQFDAILMFTRQLFIDNQQIRDFYRDFFPVIIVDEFQDTNILQWALLKDIAGRSTETKNKLFIFGDRYQRIYEFIGAMQGVIDEAKNHFAMGEVQLKTNHRFKDNEELLNFDANIRSVIFAPSSPQINRVTQIHVNQAANQEIESNDIYSIVTKLRAEDPDTTVAILTRAGINNKNTAKIVEMLNTKKTKNPGFTYFFALYSDEDKEYVNFHRQCLSFITEYISQHRSFKSISSSLEQNMEKATPSETWLSLQILLRTFINHISTQYRFLETEEKIDLLFETFRNKALKQYLTYVTDSRVILSTIHGSKGLEWDYVIIPDMEKFSFPSFPGLCRACTFKNTCSIDWSQVNPNSEFERLFRQELNVFYVAGTRARKKVYFTFSDEGLTAKGEIRFNNMSCFLSLPSLRGIDYKSER